MKNKPLRHDSAAQRRTWVSTLALLALVLAQTLALVHSVVHVPGQGRVTASAAASVAISVAAGSTVAAADHLLGHSQGDQQGLSCQLFDQLVQAGGLTVGEPCVATLELQTQVPALPVLWAVSRPYFTFHARGPPSA